MQQCVNSNTVSVNLASDRINLTFQFNKKNVFGINIVQAINKFNFPSNY